MRRHPRLRRWGKWSGLACSVLLTVTWVGGMRRELIYTHAPRFATNGAAGPLAQLGVAEASLYACYLRDAAGYGAQFTSGIGLRDCQQVRWAPVCLFRHLGRGVYLVVLLPLWIPFLLVSIPTAVLFWRDRRRVPPGHCRCGYDLTGNTSGVCPECGEAKER